MKVHTYRIFIFECTNPLIIINQKCTGIVFKDIFVYICTINNFGMPFTVHLGPEAKPLENHCSRV